MHVSFSTIAILAASLLVKEAVAGPIGKRDYYLDTEEVIITEEIVVSEQADGSFVTGTALAISTSTIDGSAVLIKTTAAASSSSLVSVATPTPSTSAISIAAIAESSSSSVKAIFIESPTVALPAPTTFSVAPTSSSAPVVVAPTIKLPETTKAAPIVVPTIAPAPAPVQTQPIVVAPIQKPTTTKSIPIATLTPPISSGSGKRGLAFNNAALLSPFTSSSKMSWAYNWGSSATGCPEQFEYVPLLWGTQQDHTGNWDAMVTKALAGGSKHLLGFNEPDFSGQANLSPGEAATGWKTYMQPYASKAKLGSPAVTNGGGSMGMNWMTSFLSACQGCTIDFLAVHWYNGGDAEAFKTYMANAYKAGGNRPLWVTEFQASGSASEQAAFLADVMAWMDETSYIERYAYFMVSDGNLISGKALSTLGDTYATAN